MKRLIYFMLTAWLLMPMAAEAQDSTRSMVDGLRYEVSMQGSATSGNSTPLWLNANKHGLSSLDRQNGYVRAALKRPLETDSARRFGIGYAVDLAAAVNYTSNFIVQQAYVEGRWLKGVLTIGSKEYPMELKNQRLSSGSQTLGINARPIPQVRIALPDYWNIPFTDGWVGIKGHIAFGKTTDDNWQTDFTQRKSKFTQDALHHTKAGYLRIGDSKNKRPLSVELGLEMATQFGGTTYRPQADGTLSASKNESDLGAFWNAFVPGGAEVNEVTYRNVQGNQLGSWVMRVNLDYRDWYLGIYADHYFDDHSSMFFLDYDGYGEGEEWDVKKDNRYFLYQLKDIMLGAEVRLKRFRYLNNIVVEYLYTKYQSGPIYHDHTQTIPDHLGGTDSYYNHGIYTGWQHWGQVMGNPLYLSPIYNDDGVIEVKDSRFVAYHLGISGEPADGLCYRLLATYRKGYGTYGKPYVNPRENFSMLAEAEYAFAEHSKLRGWAVKGAFGLDAGRWVGDNYGFQLTISKTGLLNLRKKK